MFSGKSNIKSFLLNLKTTYQLLTTRPKICLEKVDYNEYWKNRRKRGPGVPNSFQRFRAEWIVKRIDWNTLTISMREKDVLIDLNITARTYYRWKKVLLEEGLLMQDETDKKTYLLRPYSIIKGTMQKVG
jgi:hypothetical protein